MIITEHTHTTQELLDSKPTILFHATAWFGKVTLVRHISPEGIPFLVIENFEGGYPDDLTESHGADVEEITRWAARSPVGRSIISPHDKRGRSIAIENGWILDGYHVFRQDGIPTTVIEKQKEMKNDTQLDRHSMRCSLGPEGHRKGTTGHYWYRSTANHEVVLRYHLNNTKPHKEDYGFLINYKISSTTEIVINYDQEGKCSSINLFGQSIERLIQQTALPLQDTAHGLSKISPFTVGRVIPLDSESHSGCIIFNRQQLTDQPAIILAIGSLLGLDNPMQFLQIELHESVRALAHNLDLDEPTHPINCIHFLPN